MGCHCLASARSGAVGFDIQAETFGGVGDLHDAGYSAVVVVVDAYEVGAVGDDEIDVFFETADVFELEKRNAG